MIADENVHRGIARRLVEAGHEVFHIGELMPSINDEEVLAFAVERRALLLTNDTDFGELVFVGGARHGGVLLLRLEHLSFVEQAELVVNTLAVHEEAIRGAFSVLGPSQLRVRGSMIGPGASRTATRQ